MNPHIHSCSLCVCVTLCIECMLFFLVSIMQRLRTVREHLKRHRLNGALCLMVYSMSVIHLFLLFFNLSFFSKLATFARYQPLPVFHPLTLTLTLSSLCHWEKRERYRILFSPHCAAGLNFACLISLLAAGVCLVISSWILHIPVSADQCPDWKTLLLDMRAGEAWQIYPNCQ